MAPLILLTGGSGFVGSHILSAFLDQGYHVRAVVRSAASAEKVRRSHPGSDGQLHFATVPDITVAHAFDEAVKDVDGVVHSASPFVVNVTDNERDLLIPAVQGTTEILRSVVEHAPQVRRVVIASSFAAVNDFSRGLRPGYVYSEQDWNPMDYETAKTASGSLAYGKKLAEAARREFMESSQPAPSFTLSSILPPMIYGPFLGEKTPLKKLNTSSADIYRLMNGSLNEVPPTPMPAFVDVRNVAQAHVRVFRSQKGGRYLVSGGAFTYGDVCRILKEELPDITSRIPVEDGTATTTEHYSISSAKAADELGMEFRGTRECFGDMGRRFLEVEQMQDS